MVEFPSAMFRFILTCRRLTNPARAPHWAVEVEISCADHSWGGTLRYGFLAILLLATAAELAPWHATHAAADEVPADGVQVGARGLIAARRCEVAQRLDAIHRQPIDDRLPDGGNGRYLIVAMKAKPNYFVQCMYHARDTQFFCEVASGWYAPPDLKNVDFPLPAARLTALRALGYDTAVAQGNFFRDGPAAPPGVLADNILAALHEAFGATASSELEFVAPLARNLAPSCEPTG